MERYFRVKDNHQARILRCSSCSYSAEMECKVNIEITLLRQYISQDTVVFISRSSLYQGNPFPCLKIFFTKECSKLFNASGILRKLQHIVFMGKTQSVNVMSNIVGQSIIFKLFNPFLSPKLQK